MRSIQRREEWALLQSGRKQFDQRKFPLSVISSYIVISTGAQNFEVD
jgi:hypothetical protein